MVCVDVTDAGYTTTLDDFVLSCQEFGLPVRMIVAAQSTINANLYREMVQNCKKRSVGIFQIENDHISVLLTPLSQSLAGLRKHDPESFPPKYRQSLSLARETYLGGDPSKGCGHVYDELESATRKLAEAIDRKGMWTKDGQGININLQMDSWSKVLTHVNNNIARSKLKNKGRTLTKSLLSQIQGVTPFRNESGHKPKTKRQLVNRDKRLRTRFETAVDLLEDLLEAIKQEGFKI